MGLMELNHPMDMGEQLLDRDHRQICEYICQIQQLLVHGQKRSLTGSLLRKLERHTRLHFALEEGMMVSTRYPESAHHLHSHLRTMEHLQTLLSLFDQGELSLLRKAVDVLSDRNFRHVEGDDLDYALWLDVPRVPSRLIC